jgi:hypothetical protein
LADVNNKLESAEKTLQMEKDHLANLELHRSTNNTNEGAVLNSHIAAAHGNAVGEGPKTPTNTLANSDATLNPAEDSAPGATNVAGAPVDKPVANTDEGAVLNSQIAAAHRNAVGEGPKTPTNTLMNSDATLNPAEDSALGPTNAAGAPVDKPVATEATPAANAGNTNAPKQSDPDSTTSTGDGKTQVEGEAGGPENDNGELDDDDEEAKKGSFC